jgi:ubiquilin
MVAPYNQQQPQQQQQQPQQPQQQLPPQQQPSFTAPPQQPTTQPQAPVDWASMFQMLQAFQNTMSPAGAQNPLATGPATFTVPAAAQPVDTRPLEERYQVYPYLLFLTTSLITSQEQLRQLNDMGFTDFARNIAALRRTGGNIQAAIDMLVSGAI